MGGIIEEEEAEFSLKICEPGDYQIAYEADDGVTYYLWTRVKQSAILRFGLVYSTETAKAKVVKLIQVCIYKGAIELEDHEMNVSGPIYYYPTGGIAVPMTPSIFTSDGRATVCPFLDGELHESDLVEELPDPERFSPDPNPAPTGGGGGGGGGGGFVAACAAITGGAGGSSGQVINLGGIDYCFVYSGDGVACNTACDNGSTYNDAGTEAGCASQGNCETLRDSFPAAAAFTNYQTNTTAGYGCFTYIVPDFYKSPSADATTGDGVANVRRFCSCTP